LRLLGPFYGLFRGLSRFSLRKIANYLIDHHYPCLSQPHPLDCLEIVPFGVTRNHICGKYASKSAICVTSHRFLVLSVVILLDKRYQEVYTSSSSDVSGKSFKTAVRFNDFRVRSTRQRQSYGLPTPQC
jgi:hypothetical protein